MKTAKFSTAISTLIIVSFMSIASIANTTSVYTGDLPKVTVKSQTLPVASENEYSYLRFDVNKYISESEATELNYSSMDYLRFDVNNFINETEISEMPVAIELDYLRFDVNNFISGSETEIVELPAENDFGYLRFDVNNFVESNPADISEMPVNEFDYLRFDVNSFMADNSVIDELPITE